MPEEKAKPDAKNGEQKKDEKEKKRKLLGIEPIETTHEIALEGRRLEYVARTGVIPLKDEFDETEAEIFFTAYELAGLDDRANRPLTFAFNGGPARSDRPRLHRSGRDGVQSGGESGVRQEVLELQGGHRVGR